MADQEIIGPPQSNRVWAARITAAEAGMPDTLVPVRPHTPNVYSVLPRMREMIGILDRDAARRRPLAADADTLADSSMMPLIHNLPLMPESGVMLASAPYLDPLRRRVVARPSVQGSVPPPMPGRG